MRILIADDQPKVRFALRVLLERQHGLKVVGEAKDAEELLTKVKNDCPELVLLGWELPGREELDTLYALNELCPGLLVVALSCRPSARKNALSAGADAFASKADPPERLLIAINDCLRKKSPSTDKPSSQPITSSLSC
jgi:DNA-binding NarL/FixJ family response regulator